MDKIKEAIEIVKLTESYTKVLHKYALQLFEEKLKDLYNGTNYWKSFNGFIILSDNKLQINYKYGGGDIEYNDNFIVDIETKELPYIYNYSIEKIKKYNPNYGDDRNCKCGHPYYRHFDSYEEMDPIGCKYCQCYEFVEDILSDDDKDYIDYISMLFDNNIKWNIKSGPGKTLEELKLLAKENNLDLAKWQNKN